MTSAVIYWDASAVLSVLFNDRHSEDARARANRDGYHLLSSLALSEVYAVIARLHREGLITNGYAAAAHEALDTGPWRHLNISPDAPSIKRLAAKWQLRGAGLWHLAAAVTVKEKLPELTLLTYDSRLLASAMGEGLN